MSEENNQNEQEAQILEQDTNNSQIDNVENETNCQDQSQNETENITQLEPEHFRKVFVGGLSYKTDDESFKAYFSKFGELLDYVVMKDKESGKSRGFGFVTYANSSHVDDLMQNRPHNIDGRQVETKRATPKEDSGRQEIQVTVKKLFVGGIRDSINEQDLKTYFGSYGNITDCVIMRDKEKNTSRGFGFITFDDYDPVDKVIIEKHHTINGLALQCQKALPKDSNQSNGRSNQNNRQQQQQNFNSFNNDYMNNRNNNNFHNQMNNFNSNGMNFANYANPNGYANNNRNGRNGNNAAGGPMRSGNSKFNNRSQGPYANGKNNRQMRKAPRNGPNRNHNNNPMNNDNSLISNGMNQINMVGNANGMF